jgi:hypothetical protein
VSFLDAFLEGGIGDDEVFALLTSGALTSAIGSCVALLREALG